VGAVRHPDAGRSPLLAASRRSRGRRQARARPDPRSPGPA
jgi:hypothetical protein